MNRHGTNYAALGTMTGSLAVNALASSWLAKAEPAAADAEEKRLLMIGLGTVGLGFAAQHLLKRPELDNLIGGGVDVGSGALHAFVVHQAMKSAKRKPTS